MIREKIKACSASSDDGGSADSIKAPSPPSKHEKWKQAHLKKREHGRLMNYSGQLSGM